MILAALVAAVHMLDRLAQQRAIAAEQQRLRNVALLAAAGVQRQIDKFRLVAITLSTDPDVRDLLAAPSPARVDRVNTRLSQLTTAVDASVIYLLDAQATTIASGNWKQPDSFVGSNYRFRQYFRQAIRAGRWEQYAQGTRSRVPGLYLSRRIDGRDGPLGVLVVKIRFDELEREWRRAIGPSFVANKAGVILVASNQTWRFRTTKPITATQQQEMRRRLDYGDAPLSMQPDYARGAVLRTGTFDDQPLIEGSAALANGWTVHVLGASDPVTRSARNSARLGLVLVLAIMLAGWIALTLHHRVKALKEQREHQAKLDELKDRLFQANRLSTLGQIAAGVGHEINQPLTAVAMRAASARKLIEAQRPGEADAALAEILALIERIGAITAELRRFARRADRKLGRTTVEEALAGMKMLLADRIRKQAARLEIVSARQRHHVVADPARLEQVLVNLVQNALDAIAPGGRITITISRAGAMTLIAIVDDGPGIAEAIRATLFQPFSTSKDNGMGLGLVISRDIVADFGGELVPIGESRETRFEVRLKAAA